MFYQYFTVALVLSIFVIWCGVV